MNLLTTISASGVNVFAGTHLTGSYTFTANAKIRYRVRLTGWFAGSTNNFITPRLTIGATLYVGEVRTGHPFSSQFFNTSTANTVFYSLPFDVFAGENLAFGLRGTNATDTSVTYAIDIIEDDSATVSDGYTAALAAALAAIPGSGFSASTDTLEKLRDKIDTLATPADVTVTASVAVSATTAATVSTGNLALSTSYTLRQSVSSTVTDNLSTATKLWLSIKASASDTDAQSLIFVEKTAGLTVVNGATYATTGNGSLTVSGSSGAWSIAIHVDEAATALLVGRNGRYIAAVKALVGTDTVSVWEGGCIITDGIVRAYA